MCAFTFYFIEYIWGLVQVVSFNFVYVDGKSSGIDELTAEHIKYAPTSVHDAIANIFNTTARIGDPPNELQIGILSPLPKPGKKKGPPANLRPIILLSVIRKILTICLMKRCWDRLSSNIPKDQAAYQTGRSTTEQFFAVKILAEKAITSSEYKIYILMLDMSKAFDTVNRNKLFEGLEEILLPEELHLLHILTNNVKLKVRVVSEYGSEFATLVGIMQGDCLSAALFIFYLARALSHRSPLELEHNYAKPPQERKNTPELHDHTYTRPSHLLPPTTDDNVFNIAPKYTDDITYVTTAKEHNEMIKETVPGRLKQYNLYINESKTEEFDVPQTSNNNTNWRKCKLLGSLLDTKENIKRRKMLTLINMNEKQHIYKSKKLSTAMKIRHFKMFAETIFLYQCETWTITNTANNTIDAFQRRLLRYALNIKYPKIIQSHRLMELTKCRPWSETIRYRRLSWLGHLLRLPPDVPARLAFQEALRPCKKKRGHPPTTWLSVVQKDLSELNFNFNNIARLEEICKNRIGWNEVIRSIRGNPVRHIV